MGIASAIIYLAGNQASVSNKNWYLDFLNTKKGWTERVIIRKAFSKEYDIELAYAEISLQSLDSSQATDKGLQTFTEDKITNKLQIIHCSDQHHWVVATTEKCEQGQEQLRLELTHMCGHG